MRSPPIMENIVVFFAMNFPNADAPNPSMKNVAPIPSAKKSVFTMTLRLLKLASPFFPISPPPER